VAKNNEKHISRYGRPLTLFTHRLVREPCTGFEKENCKISFGVKNQVFAYFSNMLF
jgi:hypothetical protein